MFFFSREKPSNFFRQQESFQRYSVCNGLLQNEHPITTFSRQPIFQDLPDISSRSSRNLRPFYCLSLTKGFLGDICKPNTFSWSPSEDGGSSSNIFQMADLYKLCYYSFYIFFVYFHCTPKPPSKPKWGDLKIVFYRETSFLYF